VPVSGRRRKANVKKRTPWEPPCFVPATTDLPRDTGNWRRVARRFRRGHRRYWGRAQRRVSPLRLRLPRRAIRIRCEHAPARRAAGVDT